MRQLLEEKRRLEKETRLMTSGRRVPGRALRSRRASKPRWPLRKSSPPRRGRRLRARRKCWYDAEIQNRSSCEICFHQMTSRSCDACAPRSRLGRTPPRSAILQKNRTTPSATCTTTASRSGPSEDESALAAMRNSAPATWPRSTRELRVVYRVHPTRGRRFVPRPPTTTPLALSCACRRTAPLGGRFVTYDRGAPVAHR